MSQSRCSQCPDPRCAFKRFSSCLWHKKVSDGVIAIGQTTSEVSFLLRSLAPCFDSLTPPLLSMRFSLSFSSVSLSFYLYLSLFLSPSPSLSHYLTPSQSLYLALSLHQPESDRKGQNDCLWLIYPRSIHGEELFENTIDSAFLPSSSPLLSPFSLSFSLLLSSRTSNSVSNGELSRRTVVIPWCYRSTWNNPSGRFGLLRTFLLPSIVH